MNPIHPFRLALSVLLCAAVLSGCSTSKQQDVEAPSLLALQAAPQGPVVAVVNGETVTQPLFEVFARGRGLDPADPAQRQQALDALIEGVLLAQAALKGPLPTQAEVQAELALVRMQQLSGRQLNLLREEIEIGEQELRDYYAREVERTGRIEYKAQHILFADEAAAGAALAEALAPGADFSALIQKYQGIALQAADLGWANRAQTPPEFAEAFSQLGDGEVAPVLVRTRFGLHVLRREASREFTPPPFEEVREGVRQQLITQSVAEQLRALRSSAQVTAPGSTAPATP